MNGLQRVLATLAVLAAMDVTTAIVAPRDAFNPLHPHPKVWVPPRPIKSIKVHEVCPYKGLGCIAEPGP